MQLETRPTYIHPDVRTSAYRRRARLGRSRVCDDHFQVKYHLERLFAELISTGRRFSQCSTMAGSLENLSSCYIEDKPIVMEELGRGAYAVVKKVRKFYTNVY